jgi:hypothetical protein
VAITKRELGFNAAQIALSILALGLGARFVCPCIAAAARDGDPPARGDRALLVVGLPGDQEHETLFRETAASWQRWLTGPLRFPAGGVRLLFGERGDPALAAGPATRQAVADEVAAIRRTLAPEGRLWVFFLGHANERENHAFFHLPGPDLRDDELAALFSGMPCREQVFWITTASSGWFLPAFSARGRIVITATTRDQENNQTEFPQALVEVSLLAPKDVDADHDGKVSIWELFVRTSHAASARFEADGRAPTEHALLDDNGDKIGTERPQSAQEKSKVRESQDGALAKKTFLPVNAEKDSRS